MPPTLHKLKYFLNLFILPLTVLSLFAFTNKSTIHNSWRIMGSDADKYEIGTDTQIVHSGNQSIYIQSTQEKINGFVSLQQSIISDDYIGKKIKLSGFMKTENVKGRGGIWIRVDKMNSNKYLGFDNMDDRPIKGNTNWTKYELIMDVPHQSSIINFGALLSGTGKIWVDNFNIEVIGDLEINEADEMLLPSPTNINFEKQ